MYKTIVNPETGRKVNVNGKIGQRVRNNYKAQLGGGPSGGKTEPAVTTKKEEKKKKTLKDTINALKAAERGLKAATAKEKEAVELHETYKDRVAKLEAKLAAVEKERKDLLEKERQRLKE
jgi:uncharacterized protein YicC (UPF0701 family)